MQVQTHYNIPSNAVDKLAALGKAMLSLAQEIRDHQENAPAPSIPIPDLNAPKSLPSDETWFWNDHWQHKEQEANDDLQAGRVSRVFQTADELMTALHQAV